MTRPRRTKIRSDDDDAPAVDVVLVPEVFDNPRPAILDARGRRFERAAGFTRRLLRTDRRS